MPFLPFCESVNCYNNARGFGMKCALCVCVYIHTGSSSDSIHPSSVYTQQLPIYFVEFWMRARDTIQTRGGGGRTTLCALPAIFSYFSFSMLATLSGTVLEDGWLWPRMEGGKKKQIYSGARNAIARLVLPFRFTVH